MNDTTIVGGGRFTWKRSDQVPAAQKRPPYVHTPFFNEETSDGRKNRFSLRAASGQVTCPPDRIWAFPSYGAGPRAEDRPESGSRGRSWGGPIASGTGSTDADDVFVPEAVKAALGSGSIAYAFWSNKTGHPISSFRTTWAVPPVPKTRSGQTIFLFNGIQNSTMIYQPVLAWAPSAAGDGDCWSGADWYADGRQGHASIRRQSV